MRHNIDALYNADSRILILGSFPSRRSRDDGFFYAHPQNRFWPLIAGITGNAVPLTVAEKKAMCLNSGIAVWDVVASCDLVGSSDSSIKNVVVNDIARLVRDSGIQHIFLNGGTAGRLYERHITGNIDIRYDILPSTSPANAAFDMERLFSHWRGIVEYLK